MKKYLNVVAKGTTAKIDMFIEVEAEEKCLSEHVTNTENVIFDMLRSQDIDVCNISIKKKETENE